MRRVVALVVLVGLAAGGFWAFRSVAGQDTYLLSVAFGFPKDETIELQAVASTGMTIAEPPRADPITGKFLWDEWVEQHFELHDASGQRIKLGLRAHSDLIPATKSSELPRGT